MWDIREGVVGADTFIPKHAVIVTWKNMSFAGGIDISLYKACAKIDGKKRQFSYHTSLIL